LRPVSAAEQAFSSGRTPAGNVDFRTLPRRPFPDLELAGALKELFHGQGIDQVEAYQGTADRRVLVDVGTGSEAAVFRSLATACAALQHLRGRYGNRPEAIELLLTTSSRELAGQFVVTPEIAQDLLAKEVDIHTFYLAHVRF
jgi:hypothetical protein